MINWPQKNSSPSLAAASQTTHILAPVGPTRIFLEFEGAQEIVLLTVFSGEATQGCFFHFRKCLNRCMANHCPCLAQLRVKDTTRACFLVLTMYAAAAFVK